MTADQENKLSRLYELVITGDTDQPSLRSRLTKIESQQTKIYNVIKGIAIGLLLGAFVLGYVTFKDLIHIVK